MIIVSDTNERADLFSADFQRRLARWNRERLAPSQPRTDWRDELDHEFEMRVAEREFLDTLRAQVADAAAEAPTKPDEFVEWFEELENSGPGQNDPLFAWLANEASRDHIAWFLEQEAAGEAGFDDLVAMTQVKIPDQAKLELARNYWDEMGRGNLRGMHGPMLARLTQTMELTPRIETTVAESLALANAMTAMATSRQYAWHSIGALGVIELTAPGRSKCTAAGLRRIGLSNSQRIYFDLHATLDVKHSEEWNKEALLPLVSEDPSRARAMAEGALMRLRCGERCFARYRRELWGDLAGSTEHRVPQLASAA